jgi:hypothetical protein
LDNLRAEFRFHGTGRGAHDSSTAVNVQDGFPTTISAVARGDYVTRKILHSDSFDSCGGNALGSRTWDLHQGMKKVYFQSGRKIDDGIIANYEVSFQFWIHLIEPVISISSLVVGHDDDSICRSLVNRSLLLSIGAWGYRWGMACLGSLM